MRIQDTSPVQPRTQDVPDQAKDPTAARWIIAVVVLALIAGPGFAQQRTASARIDGKCQRYASSFTIPAGWSGTNVQSSFSAYAAPCSGTGSRPPGIGYKVTGPITFQEGYYYAPQNGRWGGVVQTLPAGDYQMIMDWGGANDGATISYTLVNLQYQEWRDYLERAYTAAEEQEQQARLWWNQQREELDRWYKQQCIGAGGSRAYCDAEYKKAIGNCDASVAAKDNEAQGLRYSAAVAFNNAMDKLGFPQSKIQLPRRPPGSGGPSAGSGQDCSGCSCGTGYTDPRCAVCCL